MLNSRAGIRSMPRAMIMIACIVMYITAATHYFLVFRGLVLDNNAVEYNIENALNCAAALAPGPLLYPPCNDSRRRDYHVC